MVRQANAEMTRLLGYTEDELKELTPGDLTHPADAAIEQQLIRELAAGKRSSYGIEKRNRHKDGHWVWVFVTVSLLDGGDPPLLALAHILDVTERKRSEEELRRARQNLERSNDELDQFAYVASHDLKEPLILLSAYARMLDERQSDALSEEGRTFLGHIRSEADRMKAMIDDLLDYSRLETRAEAPVAVDLAESLETALRTLGPRLEEEGGRVEVTGQFPLVHGSPTQFERLFRNLLSNAIKFRREEPPMIEVRGAQGDDEWLVEICDNGIGIDPGQVGEGLRRLPAPPQPGPVRGNRHGPGHLQAHRRAARRADLGRARRDGRHGRAVRAARLGDTLVPMAGTGATRVLIADDHPLFREAIARVISESPRPRARGRGLRRARRPRPDPRAGAGRGRHRRPHARARRQRRAGGPAGGGPAARTWSSSPPSSTRRPCTTPWPRAPTPTSRRRPTAPRSSRRSRAAARGETILGPEVQTGLAEQIRFREENDARPRLSDRELEVLRLIAQGLSAPDIALQIHLSTATVKTHLQHLYEKLGVSGARRRGGRGNAAWTAGLADRWSENGPFVGRSTYSVAGYAGPMRRAWRRDGERLPL